MSNDLRSHFNKNQQFLKLGDDETFKGLYIGWEAITTKFGKKGYEFTLEREDGSRVKWTTSNSKVVLQFSDLIDKGLKKGMSIEIHRKGIEKDDTTYTVKEVLPF